MEAFCRTDLKHIYSWTPAKKNENAWIEGFSDNHFLYRGEGYEVLPFINRYLKTRSMRSLADFQKIEQIIHSALSNSVSSHANIKEWLDNNLIK